MSMIRLNIILGHFLLARFDIISLTLTVQHNMSTCGSDAVLAYASQLQLTEIPHSRTTVFKSSLATSSQLMLEVLDCQHQLHQLQLASQQQEQEARTHALTDKESLLTLSTAVSCLTTFMKQLMTENSRLTERLSQPIEPQQTMHLPLAEQESETQRETSTIFLECYAIQKSIFIVRLSLPVDGCLCIDSLARLLVALLLQICADVPHLLPASIPALTWEFEANRTSSLTGSIQQMVSSTQ